MNKSLHYSILILSILSFLVVSCSKDDENPVPSGSLQVNLGSDKIMMEGDSAILDAGYPGSVYLWSTGAATQTIIADTTGNYWVKVTKGDSTGSDTVKIDLSYKVAKIDSDFGTIL
jgi:hypothetical protein